MPIGSLSAVFMSAPFWAIKPIAALIILYFRGIHNPETDYFPENEKLLHLPLYKTLGQNLMSTLCFFRLKIV